MRRLFLYIVIVILAGTNISCNQQKDLDLSENEIGDCESLHSQNVYRENVEVLLADFESDLEDVIGQAKSAHDFNYLWQEKLEAKKVNGELKSVSVLDTESISVKDSMIHATFEQFKVSIYNGYDKWNVSGSKEEFFDYLLFRKEEFITEINEMDFLETQKEKEIFIALVCFEIGMFEMMLEHSEGIIDIEQMNDTNLALKSVDACNWWCYTKNYAKCILLSGGAVGCVAAMFVLPEAQFFLALGTMGFLWAAWYCWADLYDKLNS